MFNVEQRTMCIDGTKYDIDYNKYRDSLLAEEINIIFDWTCIERLSCDVIVSFVNVNWHCKKEGCVDYEKCIN